MRVGGGLGSRKGNFYERHFQSILERLGFKIIEAREVRDRANLSPDICVHKFRVGQDKSTEIDFFIPSKNVGFWVTNIGQIERFRDAKTNKMSDEFNELIGICPHCKTGKLPNRVNNVIERWTCENCTKLVCAFDLLDKSTLDGNPVSKYENRSAVTQAHKQAYYRIGEYIDVKTTENKISCIEVIYNHRKEWRNWFNAIELFFDGTIFVFDDIKGIIGADNFEKDFLNKISDIIESSPSQKELLENVINNAQKIRNTRNLHIQQWLNTISQNRIKIWGSDEPVSFPIRYSLFGLLRTKNTKSKLINPYIYAVLVKTQQADFNVDNLSKREKSVLNKIGNLVDLKTKKLTEAGENYIKKCHVLYKNVVNEIKNDKIIYSHTKDFWFSKHKQLIIDVLQNLFQQSLKNNWYKFTMIANYDYKELNYTPFINQQFEPLETLTYIFLEKFKKDGIIKDYKGESGTDIYEKTWLSDMNFAKEGDFVLGTDAIIILPNGKEIFIQCKSNTSFEKWVKNQNDIKSSGITYKDSKRMVAHNVLSSYHFVNKKLQFDPERIYVGIIDGNWSSGRKDKYRILKLMYLLGVDDIFFADEIDTRFKEFLVKKSK